MIKKERVVAAENMRGGIGSVEVHHFLETEELLGHATMFARVIVKPHSSIGWHQHVGNTEPVFSKAKACLLIMTVLKRLCGLVTSA